jgi:hypothetical protein
LDVRQPFLLLRIGFLCMCSLQRKQKTQKKKRKKKRVII